MFALPAAVWPELQCQTMAPPTGPRLEGLGWTEGDENSTNRNVIPTFIYGFYTQYRPIVHRLATINNAADRQTFIQQTERLE